MLFYDRFTYNIAQISKEVKRKKLYCENPKKYQILKLVFSTTLFIARNIFIMYYFKLTPKSFKNLTKIIHDIPSAQFSSPIILSIKKLLPKPRHE
jgi:hypothetical protein